MRPGVDATISAFLASDNVFPILLAELHFTSATQYVWSGIGSITWNGHTWIGVGKFAGFSEIAEKTELEIAGIELSLTGIPYRDLTGATVDPVQEALTEVKQGNQVSLYLGFFNNLRSEFTVVSVPIFTGRMDVTTVNDDAAICDISMRVEPRRIDIKRNTERRFTDQDQKVDYPTDTGFASVTPLTQWSGVAGTGRPIWVRTPDPRGPKLNEGVYL